MRTSKQNFVVMLLRLEAQYGLCRATESIQEVIRALNLTMRDVEEEWRIWRHEYVCATLRSGISLPFSSDDIVEPFVRLCIHQITHSCRMLATPSRSLPGCLRGIRVLVSCVPVRGDPHHQHPSLGLAAGRRDCSSSGRALHLQSRGRGLHLSGTAEPPSTPIHPSAFPFLDLDLRYPTAVLCTATEFLCWCVGSCPTRSSSAP